MTVDHDDMYENLVVLTGHPVGYEQHLSKILW